MEGADSGVGSGGVRLGPISTLPPDDSVPKADKRPLLEVYENMLGVPLQLMFLLSRAPSFLDLILGKLHLLCKLLDLAVQRGIGRASGH